MGDGHETVTHVTPLYAARHTGKGEKTMKASVIMDTVDTMETVETVETMDSVASLRPQVQQLEDEPATMRDVGGWREGIAQDRQHDVRALAEVQQFHFGAHIHASDGAAGTLAAVVVDKKRQAITHLGIRVSWLRRRLCFVPLDLVTEATADTVTLSISLDAIEQRTATPAGIALTGATQVGASDKSLGRLVQLTIDRETRVLHHLVVARRLRREALLLARMMTGITAQQVAVSLGSASRDLLMPAHPDEALRRDVYDRLYAYAPLRVDLAGIEIHPSDGAVWLRGHVSSDLKRRLVEHQLQGLVGMSALHNELVADNELAAAVSMALAHDPRTARQHIGVYPCLGAVHLRGTVQTPAAREGARAVAEAVLGVKCVVNALRVKPTGDVVPVLAGVTDHADLVPGGR